MSEFAADFDADHEMVQAESDCFFWLSWFIIGDDMTSFFVIEFTHDYDVQKRRRSRGPTFMDGGSCGGFRWIFGTLPLTPRRCGVVHLTNTEKRFNKVNQII
jgi:hypothetical protein